MKSSETTSDVNTTDSKNILTIQHPLYALLAVYIPLSVLAALLPSLNFLLASFSGSVPVVLWFCSCLLSGIVVSIYWAIIKKSKADHTAANIRGSIFMVALVYCAGSLLRFGLPLGERFFPSFENLPSGFFALIIWFTVLAVKKIFEEQEHVDSYTRMYDGETLRRVMLEDAGSMSRTDIDMKKFIARYRVFFVLPFVLFVICGILGMRLSVTLAAVLVLLFLTGVFIIAFLGFLRREYAYAAEGLAFTSRSKALLAGTIVILSSAVLAFLLSSPKSLVPFGIIINVFRRLFAFLGGFLPKVTVKRSSPPEAELMPQIPTGVPEGFFETMGEATPSRFWDYVQYAALGVVGLLLLFFLLKPLLRRSGLFRGAKALPKKAVAFLKAWFKALVLGFWGFFISLRGGAGGRRLPDRAILRGIEKDVLEGYSAEKKRDIRHSAGLFARLIFWGADVLSIGWKPSYAPLEYCALLAEAVDRESADSSEIIHAIIRSGALFDKALYSSRPLTRPERDEFKALVEMVTDSNPE